MITLDKYGLWVVDFDAQPRTAAQWEATRQSAAEAHRCLKNRCFVAEMLFQFCLPVIMGAMIWASYGSSSHAPIIATCVALVAVYFCLVARGHEVWLVGRASRENARWATHSLSPVASAIYPELVQITTGHPDANAYVQKILAQGRDVYWPEFHAIKLRIERASAAASRRHRHNAGLLAKQQFAGQAH